MRKIIYFDGSHDLKSLIDKCGYIWIFDTSLEYKWNLLNAELCSDYIQKCSLFISIGDEAMHCERIVDDYIVSSEGKIFFPTIAEKDISNLLPLVAGWKSSETVFLQTKNSLIKKNLVD